MSTFLFGPSDHLPAATSLSTRESTRAGAQYSESVHTSTSLSPRPAQEPGIESDVRRDRNLAEMFRDRSMRFGDAVRWRQKRNGTWISATWRENQELVNRLIAGLAALGAQPGDHIGILSGTRWEWMAADWAILGLGGVTVTLYPSNIADTVATMLVDSEARYLFIENQEQYDKVASIRSSVPDLRKLILFEPAPHAAGDPNALRFEELSHLSQLTPAEADAFAAQCAALIQPEDMASIVYTSGTTGEPKGVILTHSNWTAEVAYSRKVLYTLRAGMVDVLFLPLAHVLGREEHLLTTEFGAETFIVESLDELSETIREAHPHFLLSVPRVYEKAYSTITAKVAASPVQRSIFRLAVAVGRAVLERRLAKRGVPLYLRPLHALADRLVFRKVRAALGGRLEFAVTGGAPMDLDILNFFHAAGVLLLEGWGLTETSSALTVNAIDNYRLGTVGHLYPGHEICVADDDELLVRGPCVFRGYYRKPRETSEAIDAEGWFHTGDLGSVDADGFVRIVDRKKDLIATSGGKKIAPQRVENLLKTIPVVSEAAVFGDRKPYIVALLALDAEKVQHWAREANIPATALDEIITEPRFHTYLDERLAEVNLQLARYESVKRYAFADEEFTVGNGLLTPSLKIRRRQIFDRYRETIERLYEAPVSMARPPAG